jgi:hypothetical protein
VRDVGNGGVNKILHGLVNCGVVAGSEAAWGEDTCLLNAGL